MTRLEERFFEWAEGVVESRWSNYIIWFFFMLMIVSWTFFTSAANAGTNQVTTVVGGKVRKQHLNQYVSALVGDVVPRNQSGFPTTELGSLGTTTYKWLRAYVSVGDWDTGDIKLHHSYNGTVGCGEGWMIANGSSVTEANYDTEHGAGHWDIYVGSSPMLNKFLPNFTGSYMKGELTTPETGAAAMAVNSTNDRHIHHSHHQEEHTHSFLRGVTNGYDHTFSSDGTTEIDMIPNPGASGCTGGGMLGSSSNPYGYTSATYPDLYTNSVHGSTIESGWGTAEDIRPPSIELIHCVRIL